MKTTMQLEFTWKCARHFICHVISSKVDGRDYLRNFYIDYWDKERWLENYRYDQERAGYVNGFLDAVTGDHWQEQSNICKELQKIKGTKNVLTMIYKPTGEKPEVSIKENLNQD